MGFNSTLVILNDQLHDIENDPDFGKRVARAIRAHGYPEADSYERGFQVIGVQHADNAQVLIVGANRGRMVGCGYWQQDDEGTLKAVLAQVLRKKKESAP